MPESMTEIAGDSSSIDMDVVSSTKSGEGTCHVLPCNINYEGMAKTHTHFKPVLIEEGVLASAFRGRGLLAVKSDDVDETRKQNHPLLLSLKEDQIQVKESIHNIVEWHHEHNIQSLKFKDKQSSRVKAAKEWIEISKSVSVATYAFYGTVTLTVNRVVLCKNHLSLFPSFFFQRTLGPYGNSVSYTTHCQFENGKS